MLAFLLIIRKNGRRLKPYGVNALEVCNMKFAFICIVTVISCSVCVEGAIDIYPGLKYGRQIRRAIFANPEDDSTDYPDHYWSWPGKKVNVYGDGDGDDVRKFQNIDLALKKFLLGDKKYRSLQRVRNPYNPYKNLESVDDDYGQYRRVPANLDEVRMYPQDDDFNFKEEDDDELFNTDRLGETNTRKYLKQMLDKTFRDDEMNHEITHGVAMEEDDTDATPEANFTPETLKNVQFAEDPTEFAYAPSDPRFYDHPQKARHFKDPSIRSRTLYEGSEETIGKLKINSPENEVKVKQRSEKQGSSENYPTTNQLNLIDRQPDVVIRPSDESPRVYIIAIVAGISAAATVGLIAVGIGWYNLQKHVKNASDVEYPAYGVTGPNKDTSPSGDRRLAQSAQMYHYQHQKQQILAMENRVTAVDRHGSVSEADSEEENEEGDYTVYECPGLAPTGEMEVKNPMFQDDPTPAQTPPVKVANGDEKK